MNFDRKQFMFGAALAAITSELGFAMANAEAADDPNSMPTTPAAAHQTEYFFKNSTFEFVFVTALGRAY